MKRREFMVGGTTLGVAALASNPVPGTQSAGVVPPVSTGEQLRVASCQFPVSASIAGNAEYIGHFMAEAAKRGAHLLHTSEASLPGYAGLEIASFAGYDWEMLRRYTRQLRRLATQLQMWLVLGSAHYLDAATAPTNCLYLIDPAGCIVNRYDKCFCTTGDQKHYSTGDRLVTHDIRGVRVGLAICYDVCWPQLYIGYRELGATVMLHSFHNAGGSGPNCLDELNFHEAATRCADNRMWAVCNNSSRSYSHWGSFVARPDSTIPRRLERNQPGMLVHDFPDGLSETGWYHNERPMQKRGEEIMSWGSPVKHPRKENGRAEP